MYYPQHHDRCWSCPQVVFNLGVAVRQLLGPHLPFHSQISTLHYWGTALLWIPGHLMASNISFSPQSKLSTRPSVSTTGSKSALETYFKILLILVWKTYSIFSSLLGFTNFQFYSLFSWRHFNVIPTHNTHIFTKEKDQKSFLPVFTKRNRNAKLSGRYFLKGLSLTPFKPWAALFLQKF